MGPTCGLKKIANNNNMKPIILDRVQLSTVKCFKVVSVMSVVIRFVIS